MLPRVCLLAVALECLSPGAALAQDRERKRAAATRVPDGSIRMDGRLDEPVWREAMPLAGFTQKEPVEGNPATNDLDVRFVYDAGALYVGARMTSSAPIQAPLGRRDEVEQAEHLLVSLDTYLDRRTASTFGVTANGVRLDYYYASDNDFADDDTFNPVWEARTIGRRRGWTAELRIPFSQLRFNERVAAGLGAQHAPLDPVAQRRGVLVAHPAHRRTMGVALRRPARPRRAAAGSASSCCRTSPATRGSWATAMRRSVQRAAPTSAAGRRRRQAGHRFATSPSKRPSTPTSGRWRPIPPW